MVSACSSAGWREAAQGCTPPAAGAEWSSPGATGSWAAAGGREEPTWERLYPWRPLVKCFDVAISVISLPPPAQSAPGSEKLRDAFHLRQPRAPPRKKLRTQGDRCSGCQRHPGLRVSAPAPLSGSRSFFLTHQHRCSRGCWSKDGLALANRCQAVTENLLFKRDFIVLDFMTFTA